MLTLIPAQIKDAPEEYRSTAARYRAISPRSVEAAVFEYVAKDLAERIKAATDAATTTISVPEYAAQCGVSGATVRKWIARGEVAAIQDQKRNWRIFVASPAIGGRTVLCDSLAAASEVVYGLIDPAEPDRIRYVGRTFDPAHRYRSHCMGGADAITEWVQSLAADRRAPTMVLVERCFPATVADREAYWIEYFRKSNQADLNRSTPRRKG